MKTFTQHNTTPSFIKLYTPERENCGSCGNVISYFSCQTWQFTTVTCNLDLKENIIYLLNGHVKFAHPNTCYLWSVINYMLKLLFAGGLYDLNI